MAYCNECPYCGANLDPGEHCNCKEEAAEEKSSVVKIEYQVFYDDNNMFLNSDYPWMHASLDGELVDQGGRKGILEIKTTNILQSMQKEKWQDRIPDNYFCQVLHYLAVTGYEFAALKAQLKTEWGGELRITTKHYFIERKDVEEDIKYLIDAEKRFWSYVESGRRPDLILPAI